MNKMTIEEFEAHISDRITQIAFEKGTGKLTEKQAMTEVADLARWCVDRMNRMSPGDRARVLNSRLLESLSPRD